MKIVSFPDIKEKELYVIINNEKTLISRNKVEEMLLEPNYEIVQLNNSKPYVYKILDYQKYLYEQKKKEKELKKNQPCNEVKELKFSMYIEDNDINTKVKHAERFLESNKKVKIVVEFRGREVVYIDKAYELIDKILLKIKNGEKESKIKRDDKKISIILKHKK